MSGDDWKRDREKSKWKVKQLDNNSKHFETELWKHSQSSGYVQEVWVFLLLQQHLFWQWRHRRRNPQIRKGGKPLVQPHRALTKALSVQYHENRAIKCAPNRRAISGTATWIHHQNVPLTQQAGFMAPSIKLAPDWGGKGKNNSSPFENMPDLQINPLQETNIMHINSQRWLSKATRSLCVCFA